MMAKKPVRSEAKEAKIPRSRQLFEAGFKTRADAARCINAIIADLAADRINATEANQLTGATLGHMRGLDRKAQREQHGRPRRKRGTR